MNKRQRFANLRDWIVYRACEMFMDGKGVSEIKRFFERDTDFRVSREQIYPMLREGIRRGFLSLVPPQEMKVSRKLHTRHPNIGDIRILNVRGESTVDRLAEETSRLTISLIEQLRTKKDGVHIGFAGGRTLSRCARVLARDLRLHTFPSPQPKLVLHAVASGFMVKKPTTAPNAFFSLFSDLNLDVEYVGLFAAPLGYCRDYETVKSLPGVKPSFDEAENIDIVVTSLAYAEDDDCLMKSLMKMASEEGQRNLEQAGWIGDVQYRPYSEEGPILVDTDIRAVTLFELEDLVKMATNGKHVILIAGPCMACGRHKAEAVRPLLQNPKLRVFNHLVTDITTALELLPPEEKANLDLRDYGL